MTIKHASAPAGLVARDQQQTEQVTKRYTIYWLELTFKKLFSLLIGMLHKSTFNNKRRHKP